MICSEIGRHGDRAEVIEEEQRETHLEPSNPLCASAQAICGAGESLVLEQPAPRVEVADANRPEKGRNLFADACIEVSRLERRGGDLR